MSHEFVQCLIICDREGCLTLAKDPGPEGGSAATWRKIKGLALLPEAYRRDHPQVVKLFKDKGIRVAVNGDVVRLTREERSTRILVCLLDESAAATMDPLEVKLTRFRVDRRVFFDERDIRVKVVTMDIDVAHTLPAVDDTNRDVFRQCVRFKFSCEGSLLHEVIESKCEVLARMALDDGADINATKSACQFTSGKYQTR